MRWFNTLAWRIRGFFWQSRLDRDLDDELRTHIEMLVDENVRQGMTIEEARRAAMRSFGGVTQTKEAYRDQRGLPMLETVIQDLRYGLRILRKHPGFTVVAVLTLALGIGANTAMFSVLDAVMIQTLPVRSADQLLMLKWTARGFPSVIEDLEGNSLKGPNGDGIMGEAFSYPSYESLRAQNTVFSDVVAFCSNLDNVNAQFNGRAESAVSQPVSGNYFSGLGVDAYSGRAILALDRRWARGLLCAGATSDERRSDGCASIRINDLYGRPSKPLRLGGSLRLCAKRVDHPGGICLQKSDSHWFRCLDMTSSYETVFSRPALYASHRFRASSAQIRSISGSGLSRSVSIDSTSRTLSTSASDLISCSILSAVVDIRSK
jgi:hypothetical protein